MIQTDEKKARRQTARVSILGTTQLHLRNPFMVAWWSATVPGFGHLLLNKYLRAYLLILWEMIINTQTKLNIAMVYSFTGRFEAAKEVLDLRWMSLYAPVYIFAIYDSYRNTVDLNQQYLLAEREKSPFKPFSIHPLEINYLDKRSPWVAIIWSIVMPGMGQLYLHRILTAFYLLGVWILVLYQSHALEVLHFTLMGQFSATGSIANAEWLMFIPSIYFYAVYDSYVNTAENNKLFDKEQRAFLKRHYQGNQAKKMLTEMRMSK